MKIIQTSAFAFLVGSTRLHLSLGQEILTVAPSSSAVPSFSVAPFPSAPSEGGMPMAPSLPMPSPSPPTGGGGQPAWGPVRWEAQQGAPVAGISDPMCAAIEACSMLEGMCCPTVDGVFLLCCQGFPPEPIEPTVSPAPTITARPTGTPTVSPAPTVSMAPIAESATCQANEQCSELGLEGFCCPTVDGFGFLDCCDPEVIPSSVTPSSTSNYIALANGDESGAAWILSTTGLALISAACVVLLTN